VTPMLQPALRAAGPRGRFAPLTPMGAATTAYLAAVGAAFAAWHAIDGPWTLLLCVAPALVGALLATTSQADRGQYTVRLLAAGMMLPILVLFVLCEDHIGVAAAIGFVVVHVAAFLLQVVWLSSFTTRIDPPDDVAPVAATALARRLAALPTLGLPIGTAADGEGRAVRLRWTPPNEPGRQHVVTLWLDASRHEAIVTERVRADDAAPANADERSMRDSLADEAFDPTRPDAQRVWLRVAQTTLLDDARLDAAPVASIGERLVWRGPSPPALADSNTLMACLAVLVLEAGWAWRPKL
jgi:hypothetical protein